MQEADELAAELLRQGAAAVKIFNVIAAKGGAVEYLRRLKEEGNLNPETIDSALGLHLKPFNPPITAEGSAELGLGDEHFGLVMLDTVKPEKVSWFWPYYIPLGKITLLEGDPGLGKSTITIDLGARSTQGLPMPDGTTGISCGVVILSMEDGLADTIVPRFKAAGADCSKIVALQAVRGPDGKPRLPTVVDIEGIKSAIEKVGAKLFIVDPLMAHLPGITNSWRDQDVRAALTPLAILAEETGIAVVLVRHLNKSGGGQAIYRGGGSIGIAGAARCAYLVAKDPENEERRIFACVKNNLAKNPPSLCFGLEGVDGSSRIVWGGQSNHTANQLLAVFTPKDKSALDEAESFLIETLSEGPVKAKDVLEKGEEAGFSARTIRRAKKELGVIAEKEKAFQGAWVWKLSAKDGQESPKVTNKTNGHLCDSLAPFDEKGEE